MIIKLSVWLVLLLINLYFLIRYPSNNLIARIMWLTSWLVLMIPITTLAILAPEGLHYFFIILFATLADWLTII